MKSDLIENLVLGVVAELFPGASRRRLLEAAWPDGVRDEDEATWTRIALAGTSKAIEDASRDTVVRQCRELVLENPHAKGIVEKAIDNVVGDEGVRFELEGASDRLEKEVEDFWAGWAERNPWAPFCWELIERTLRDGESFIRVFDKKRDDCYLRFIDPLDVRDPQGKISGGIETRPKDVVVPINYLVASETASSATKVPADQVIHVKFGVDSDVKRGLPLLYCVKDRLRRYEKFLDARMVLNQIRSAIAVIREHQAATAAEVATWADTKKHSTKTMKRSGATLSVRRQIWHPGTILDTTPGIKYSFLEPKTEADDASKDGRMALLSVAAGVNQPAYLVTNDTTRANYASTTIEERIGVRSFGRYQKFFAVPFLAIWRRVIAWGVRTRRLKSAQAKTARCVVRFPRIKTRNPVDEATADMKVRDSGAMSRQTMAERAGLDWRRERQRLEEEEAESISGSKTPAPPREKGPPGEDERARGDDRERDREPAA